MRTLQLSDHDTWRGHSLAKIVAGHCTWDNLSVTGILYSNRHVIQVVQHVRTLNLT